MYIDFLVQELKDKGFKVNVRRKDLFTNENLESPKINKDNGWKIKKKFNNYLHNIK